MRINSTFYARISPQCLSELRQLLHMSTEIILKKQKQINLSYDNCFLNLKVVFHEIFCLFVVFCFDSPVHAEHLPASDTLSKD